VRGRPAGEESGVTGWPLIIIAVSSAVIALAVFVLLVGVLVALRQLGQLSDRMTRVVESLDRDARPTLESVRRTAEDAGEVVRTVRDEVRSLGSTSRDVRTRVERTAAALEERFIEFDTLLDLLQDELEDTVLDVSALLRTTRRGTGLMRGIKRVLGRRR
jgi:uncharacterized protein YoxC